MADRFTPSANVVDKYICIKMQYLSICDRDVIYFMLNTW